MSHFHLTERQTLQFLDGIQMKDPTSSNGFLISALPGKWIPFENGNFYTIRLTGVKRESHKEDIPPWVTAAELPSPERFSDKLIKETNRSAVLVIARGEAENNVYIPRHVNAVLDMSMDYKNNKVFGFVECLIVDSKPVKPSDDNFWHISASPIVLIDHTFPLVKDHRNERVIEDDGSKTNCINFQHLGYRYSKNTVVVHDESLYKPKRQRFTEEQLRMPVDHNFEREKEPCSIAFSGNLEENNAYIDTERRVVPDGFVEYKSGPVFYCDEYSRIYY